MSGPWRDQNSGMYARGYDPNMRSGGHGSHDMGPTPSQMGRDPRSPNGSSLRQNETFLEDYFVYVAAIGTLTTLANSITNIQIQADSSFEWLESTFSGNLNGNAEPWTDATILPVTAQITDTGAGRALFNAPVPISMIAGTGKQPFILPVSRIFQANAIIQVSATSYSASTWNNIYLSFIGRKIWNVKA